MTIDPHALAAAYSLDALDPVEREEFETHLAGCAECRSEVAHLGIAAAHLADAAATIPPADLKARVMRQVASTPQTPAGGDSAASAAGADPPAPPTDLDARRRRFTAATLLAAAAAFVLFAVGAVALVAVRSGGSDVDSVLDSADVRIVALETQVEGTPGTVEVAWSPGDDRLALIADDLAAPGAGRAYALWAIAGGEPIPAGLFVPDDGSIRAAGDVDDVQAVAFGITIEPEAGSPAPTGEILYLGNV